MAEYLGCIVFENDDHNIAVLVDVLNRLAKLEKLNRKDHTGIYIEDVVNQLTDRLYHTRFGNSEGF